MNTPLLLLILDGWGYSETHDHNAIYHAHTPTWNYLYSHYPHLFLSTSGESVGLPEGQMGNSEVGHLNIGAGRTVFQDLPRIDHAINSGEFFKNSIFINAIADLKKSNKTLHLMGLVSPGGVHSHENHLIALLKLAHDQNFKKIVVHAFLDGRDTPPSSAKTSLEKIEKTCHEFGGRIASITGRYYAMDRDKRWERIQRTYDMLTQSKAAFYEEDALSALQHAYDRGETDEFVQPTIINSQASIEDGDAIIFFNFRADRARQLSRALISPDFSFFKRENLPRLSHFISMTQYATDIPSEIAFLPIPLTHILGDCVSRAGLTQLRIAETEKYAHVTFFFNGGVETPFLGEERVLIPSPKIATYDLQPEMSAPELTQKLTEAILSRQFDFIVCNYANPDMVGHTGNYEATVKAIEAVDVALKQIYEALKKVKGEMVITADHGNAECMFDSITQQPHTAHTQGPVPFIYVGRPATVLKKHGTLADVAPTLLRLLGLSKPPEMTGETLLKM